MRNTKFHHLRAAVLHDAFASWMRASDLTARSAISPWLHKDLKEIENEVETHNLVYGQGSACVVAREFA